MKKRKYVMTKARKAQLYRLHSSESHIADLYVVNYSTISRIVNNKSRIVN